MDIYEIKTKATLETIECSECGILFAIPKDKLDRERESTGNGWYCPNGHRQVFCETEAVRLSLRLYQAKVELKRQRNRTDEAFRRLAVLKENNAHLRKRIQAGVCPECHRHFDNLQRHMKMKHSSDEV